MRNIIYHKILIGAAGLSVLASVASCEDYLDKAPETTITQAEAFKDFRSLQGYVEGIYTAIPDKEKCNWCPSWNWGDDEVFNPEADDRMTHQVDLGNFKAWQETGNWLCYNSNQGGNGGYHFGRLWTSAFPALRRCNMAIENIDMMVGTKEERELILGQAYFFRAWFHFEMMSYFGGLPYINRVFDAGEELREKRLSYQECADCVAADLLKAIEYLPIDWDQTVAGNAYGTGGKNDLRVNKITALGYLGKNYLWAGSPLMKNGAQLGGTKTYDYDKEYCKKAADAFAELINLVETGQTQYGLAEFDYDKTEGEDGVARGIYDHTKSKTAKSCFTQLFYDFNWVMPGGDNAGREAIMRGLSGENGQANNTNWNTSKVFGPKVAGLVEHDNVIHQPTANMIDAYGMANGLPLPDDITKPDPVSGWDPTHPYKDRDPRFYHDIVFDGFKYVNAAAGKLEASKEYLRYCSLYTGGAMRDQAHASQTGYFCQKLVPHTCNIADQSYDYGKGLHCYIPFMRLADIYLMYAEACAAADYQSPKCELSAVDAVNRIRTRCGAGPLGGPNADAKYTTGTGLMDEIRRERAVELAFEGFRFSDLQRWLLLTEPKYTMKYSHEFDRVESDDFYAKNDPKDARVQNFRKKEILTRKFTTKHYWFPLPESQVYLYPEFKQNPGW